MAAHRYNNTGSNVASSVYSSGDVKIGSISVTMTVENLKFIPQKEVYEIEIGDAMIVSTNPQKNSITIHLSTSKMKKINKELADDDIDELLDEIETQNEFIHNREQTKLALQPRNIKKEWSKISQKQPPKFAPFAANSGDMLSSPILGVNGNNYGNAFHFDKPHINSLNVHNGHSGHNKSGDSQNSKMTEPVIFEETCSFYIGQCRNIERIIFIMKYYRFWREYKQKQYNQLYNHQNNRYPSFGSGINVGNGMEKIFQSMTEFINNLDGYSKIDLMNDYLHVRKCHFSNDLIGFFRDKLQECMNNNDLNGNNVNDINDGNCICIDRNNETREIYSLSTSYRGGLYWIDNESEEGSLSEIREINLQHDLDVIHSSFLHDAMSNGTKYISLVDIGGDNKLNEENKEKEKDKEKERAVLKEEIYDEFGIYFDYWKDNRRDFCNAKYPNIKSEILNNKLHSISWNDFNCIYERAKDWLLTEFAKYSMNAKREFDAMKGAVKYGDNISIDHVMAIQTYTNYKRLQEGLKRGCKKIQFKERKEDVMIRNMEIANWCRLLKESIYYFGDLLIDGERLYHGISKKLMFQRVAKKFNLPMSTTTSYIVANKFATKNGICLQLSKMFALEENNLYLDVSYFSDYPNEYERVIYGGRLGFVDIIYNGLSHLDQVMSLRLYQKIIDGDWFSLNINNLFQKRYQNEIIKMIKVMMKDNDIQNYDNNDVYIQQLFECIVQNVGFGTKTIWINEEECSKLIPELNKLFFSKFLPFLRKYHKIKMKYCSLMNMKIKRDALLSSSRQYQLYSSEYKYKINNDDEIELHFRCYKQYDAVRNEDVLMAKFECKSLPSSISSVKMYGGLWFPQIHFDRWDYCTLSHNKLSQGCPLFQLSKIYDIDTLRIEICFQLYRVYDQYGKRLKL